MEIGGVEIGGACGINRGSGGRGQKEAREQAQLWSERASEVTTRGLGEVSEWDRHTVRRLSMTTCI